MSTTTPAPTAAEAKDLATLALFLSMDVAQALEAAIATQAADLYFAQQGELFWLNPANTFPHLALAALEERAVVRIAEGLKNKRMLVAASGSVRRKADLIGHRNVLSHSYMIQWSDPKMQTFYDSDRQWTDRRAALVWDMWRSINERLRELGQSPRDEQIVIGAPMAMMLHNILRLSVKPESAASIPTETILLDHLTKFRDQFLDLLVKNPDGTA